MIVPFLIAWLGGVLTIVSPCILPVLPFVFARAGQPFLKSTLPMLVGMAATFAAVATLAAVSSNKLFFLVEDDRSIAREAFLYGEEDARKREANNSWLHAGEQQYIGGP